MVAVCEGQNKSHKIIVFRRIEMFTIYWVIITLTCTVRCQQFDSTSDGLTMSSHVSSTLASQHTSLTTSETNSGNSVSTSVGDQAEHTSVRALQEHTTLDVLRENTSGVPPNHWPTTLGDLPEHTLSAISELTTSGILPEHTTISVLPGATTFNTIPELTTFGVLPEHTTNVVTPEHTTNVVTPEHTTNVVTPEHTTNVVTPEHTTNDALLVHTTVRASSESNTLVISDPTEMSNKNSNVSSGALSPVLATTASDRNTLMNSTVSQNPTTEHAVGLEYTSALHVISDEVNLKHLVTGVDSVGTTTPSLDTTLGTADTAITSADTTLATEGTTLVPADIKAQTNITLAPGDTTLAPLETKLAPGDTTLAPLETTLAPGDTTLAPLETTLAPGDTTLAPLETTLAPGDTTLAPLETTLAPGDTTLAPLETTLVIGDKALALGNTTLFLEDTSLALVGTTPAPAVTTLVPTNTTLVPTDTSLALVGTTPAPAVTTLVLTNTTLVPTDTTLTLTGMMLATVDTTLSPADATLFSENFSLLPAEPALAPTNTTSTLANITLGPVEVTDTPEQRTPSGSVVDPWKTTLNQNEEITVSITSFSMPTDRTDQGHTTSSLSFQGLQQSTTLSAHTVVPQPANSSHMELIVIERTTIPQSRQITELRTTTQAAAASLEHTPEPVVTETATLGASDAYILDQTTVPRSVDESLANTAATAIQENTHFPLERASVKHTTSTLNSETSGRTLSGLMDMGNETTTLLSRGSSSGMTSSEVVILQTTVSSGVVGPLTNTSLIPHTSSYTIESPANTGVASYTLSIEHRATSPPAIGSLTISDLGQETIASTFYPDIIGMLLKTSKPPHTVTAEITSSSLNGPIATTEHFVASDHTNEYSSRVDLLETVTVDTMTHGNAHRVLTSNILRSLIVPTGSVDRVSTPSLNVGESVIMTGVDTDRVAFTTPPLFVADSRTLATNDHVMMHSSSFPVLATSMSYQSVPIEHTIESIDFHSLANTTRNITNREYATIFPSLAELGWNSNLTETLDTSSTSLQFNNETFKLTSLVSLKAESIEHSVSSRKSASDLYTPIAIVSIPSNSVHFEQTPVLSPLVSHTTQSTMSTYLNDLGISQRPPILIFPNSLNDSIYPSQTRYTEQSSAPETAALSEGLSLAQLSTSSKEMSTLETRLSSSKSSYISSYLSTSELILTDVPDSKSAPLKPIEATYRLGLTTTLNIVPTLILDSSERSTMSHNVRLSLRPSVSMQVSTLLMQDTLMHDLLMSSVLISPSRTIISSSSGLVSSSSTLAPTNIVITPAPLRKNITVYLFFKSDCELVQTSPYKEELVIKLYKHFNELVNINIKDISIGNPQCNPQQIVIAFRNVVKSTLLKSLSESGNTSFTLGPTQNKVSFNITDFREVVVAPEKSVNVGDIAVIVLAICICVTLVLAGVAVFIKEIYLKKTRRNISYSTASPLATKKTAGVDPNEKYTTVEMQEEHSVEDSYCSPYDAEYSSIGNGEFTSFTTSASCGEGIARDYSLDTDKSNEETKAIRRSRNPFQKPKKKIKDSKKSEKYGLVIGVLGYKKQLVRSDPEHYHHYAVPENIEPGSPLEDSDRPQYVNSTPSYQTEEVNKSSLQASGHSHITSFPQTKGGSKDKLLNEVQDKHVYNNCVYNAAFLSEQDPVESSSFESVHF
ncbi:mucin-12 [Biomphalaria glabrata]